jgi:hypothetical protein
VFGLVNRFIDRLQAVTTNNYDTIADFYTLQFTGARSLVFSVCYCLLFKSSLHRHPYRTELSTDWSQSQSYFTTGGLLPISSSWRKAPSDPRPEIFFNWTLAVIHVVFMLHPLWREDGFVSYEYAWPFVKCTYRTYSMLLKILPFALYTSPLSV